MSDEIKYVDVDSEEFEDAPHGLREAYKKLVTKHKEITGNYTKLQAQVTSRAVTDVLADQKFKNPERVKSALLGDGIDPLNTEAVNEWLSANGDDYVKVAAQTGEAEQEQQVAATVDPATQQAFQSLQVEGVSADNDKLARVLAKITPEMRGNDVEKLYKEHGI